MPCVLLREINRKDVLCMNLQRLDKIISSQFNIPRKVTKAIIHRGKVKIDGNIIRDPSLQVDVDKVTIEYKGQTLNYKEHVYIMLNKPKGVLSASEDKNRETVVDLVPSELFRQGLFPVGRLDKDTTGLILITDDGDFAHQVISPKKNIFKTYKVTLDGDLTEEGIALLEKGVTLADGTVCKPALVKSADGNVCVIKISEGKYHQIKRMFGVLELGVNELERVAIGGLSLPQNLEEGNAIELSEAQKSLIFVK